jgi:dCMP deaminase
MRKSWADYFLGIAQAVSERATCDRLHVGCVLVETDTKVILATGYNGSVRGAPHCDDVGHDMDHGHCVRTVHAEGNAIAQAASRGISVAGATAYLTARPCWPCCKLLLNSGIVRIVYAASYRDDERVTNACMQARVDLVHHPVTP